MFFILFLMCNTSLTNLHVSGVAVYFVKKALSWERVPEGRVWGGGRFDFSVIEVRNRSPPHIRLADASHLLPGEGFPHVRNA